MKTVVNGTKEIYYYDEAGQLISVTNGTGTTLREYIYWGNEQIAFVNTGVVHYVHNDHLNTPQVVTNAAQQVVWMGDCSGLIPPDTLMRDNKRQPLRCHYDPET